MQIKNLSLSFGTQDIFKNINLYIKEKEKVGIVGVNGAGKTTFFKVILGLIEPDEGKIIFNKNTHISFLPQVIDEDTLYTNDTVFNFLLTGRPIDKILNKIKKTYEQISQTKDIKKQNELMNKADKLQKELEYWNYYSSDNELLKIITGMNITDEMLNQKLSELSGGQKSKVAFARLLYSMPEIILLDEPTNHLDKATKDFVIDFLKTYKGSVYIISHDIDFLNKITTKTLFLDKRTKNMKIYNGNYDIFIKLKRQEEENLIKESEIQNKEIEKLQDIVNKYQNSSGKRKKMAQDREKKLNKILENKIEINPVQKQIKLKMELNQESTNYPIKVSNLQFKYNKLDKKYIINNLSFELFKGEKFLVVGENGIGKSTLLKLIVGRLIPDNGEIIIGAKTDIAYYAQEHELLDNDKTILENFKNINMPENKIRNVLGRFLFFDDDVFKKVKILSPGEKSRVALAKLSLSGANLLILDEPTNHLDPETQVIIAETLKTFEGTMLVVSHNTNFVNNLGIERVLELPSGKISYYNSEIIKHFDKIKTNNI